MRAPLLPLVALSTAIGVILTAASGSAQRPATSAVQPTFRTETTLVEVSAVVTDESGQPVTDLAASDFEIFEDGEPRPLAGFRYLMSASPAPPRRPQVSGAQAEAIRSSTAAADAPVFVLLLDDLNVALKRSHRVIRGAKGLLAQIPPEALVGVLSTSGLDGTALTLTVPGPEHMARVEAFRGQLLIRGGAGSSSLSTPNSLVGAPCGAGSLANHSSSCADPTRAARRLQTLESVARLLSHAGSRRKVIFWVTEDMGATPVDPTEGRAAQAAALQAVLSADVAVYPVHPDELPSEKDTDPGGVQMLGNNAVSIDTDELAGVTLDQMARESGGRWIVDINDHEIVLAKIVKQNSAAYLLAYESRRSREPGRHRIDVRVTRRGVRVYARRGYVVPKQVPADATAGNGGDRASRLGDVLQQVVPHGPLALQLLITPMLADGRQGAAFVTIRVDAATALDQPVDLAVVTFDKDGTAANQQSVRLSHPAEDGAWEVSFELQLSRGIHQLRAAAVTADGARTGLVVDRIEIIEPGRRLWLGAPLLRIVDVASSSPVASVRTTLQRVFDVGHPLALQSEVAGRPVADGKASVSARLVDAAGATVRDGRGVIGPGPNPRKDRAMVTAIVETHGLAAGAYTLIWEARADGRDDVVRHATPITLTSATAPEAQR